MIGVGVYTTSGFTLAALGSPARVIAAWLVGGLIAISGAIGYGALASRFSESGGEYLFLSRTLHPVAGLMAGWVSLLAGFTGAIAIAALGLEKYLTPILFENPSTLPGGSVAISVVLLAAVMHTVGVRSAARVQDFIVVLKLACITGFLLFAIGKFQSWQGSLTVGPQRVEPFSLWAFAGQLVWISFSYAGFNAAVYVAGEVDDPERNVPKALVRGTVLVTLIYVALNTIFVLAPTPDQIVGDQIDQVAATAAIALGGNWLELLVRLVIVISLFTSVSALVMTGPRVYSKMADDGFFPNFFRFDDKPPITSIWFQAGLAIIAISISGLQTLLGYLGLTLSVCSALTVSMLFVLRLRGEDIRLPLYGIVPGIYVIGTLVIAILYGISQPSQATATGLTLVVGLALYPFVSKRLQN